MIAIVRSSRHCVSQAADYLSRQLASSGSHWICRWHNFQCIRSDLGSVGNFLIQSKRVTLLLLRKDWLKIDERGGSDMQYHEGPAIYSRTPSSSPSSSSRGLWLVHASSGMKKLPLQLQNPYGNSNPITVVVSKLFSPTQGLQYYLMKEPKEVVVSCCFNHRNELMWY